MNYLVVSDNHGDRQILVELVEIYQGKVDYFFHCGDSELDGTDELWSVFQVVQGNCDFGLGYEKNRLIDTGQDKIYLSHGHLSNVGFGLTQLSLEAEEKGADMIFFGHTHQISCEMDQNQLFLNPGSISQPRGPMRIPTYALIESLDAEIQVQYCNRAHHFIEELAFVFPRNN